MDITINKYNTFIKFKIMSGQSNLIVNSKNNKASFEWEISNFSEIFNKSQTSESIKLPILRL